MKTEVTYVDISEDVETRFYTLDHELDRSLLKGKKINIIGLMKGKLGGEIMTEIGVLR